MQTYIKMEDKRLNARVEFQNDEREEYLKSVKNWYAVSAVGKWKVVEQNIGEKIIWRSYWRFGAWTEIFAKMIKADKRHDAVDLMYGVVNTNFALDTDLKIVGNDFGKIKMEVGT
jgi:hypothetical protein